MTISDKYLKLVISGCSFLDIVVNPDKIIIDGGNNTAQVSVQLGGVFNIARQLNILSVDYCLLTSVGSPVNNKNITGLAQIKNFDVEKMQCFYSADEMCTAVIIGESYASSRTSFVNSGIGRKYIPKDFINSEYHHISYLDYLDSYNFNRLKLLRAKCSFISVDLCINNPTADQIVTLIEKLKLVDLLIISDKEFTAYFKNSENFMKIRQEKDLSCQLVVHSPTYVDIYEAAKLVTHRGKFIGNRNVLGMGDRFVAYFYSQFINNADIVKSAILAYDACQGDLKK